MAHKTTNRGGPDLDALARREDPEGRPTFLTVFADLRTGEWESRLKQHAEAIRADLGDELAATVKFHQAFDEAFIEVDRLSRTEATAVAVIVSPVHHVSETIELSREVETSMELAARPKIDQARGTS